MSFSEINYFKIETNTLSPRKGQALIAEPFLNDIYFKRSIVLLTEHGSDGTVGFVLNKPVNMQLSEIINDLPNFDAYISIGGPVNTNTVHYIHTLGDKIPNSLKVKNDLWWGGDFETLKELIKSNQIGKHEVMFFLGYSGWMPNQLKNELMQNSWLVCNIDTRTIMFHNKNSLWTDMLQRMGNRYKMWINSPEDPSMN